MFFGNLKICADNILATAPRGIEMIKALRHSSFQQPSYKKVCRAGAYWISVTSSI
jgi:hypothetical protein